MALPRYAPGNDSPELTCVEVMERLRRPETRKQRLGIKSTRHFDNLAKFDSISHSLATKILIELATSDSPTLLPCEFP